MSELDPQQKGVHNLPENDGVSKRIVRLHGFFTDPEGGLHRGIPTFVYDEEGNEIPVFREHNTGKFFPRVVPPEEGKTSTQG